MKNRPPTHRGQLAASTVTAWAMTALLLAAFRGVDGPHGPDWAPALGAVIVLWVFACVWALIAVTLSVRAAWRLERVAARPVPGAGFRPAPPLPDLYAVAADDWLASEPADVPPVDPAAAVQPRPGAPVTDEDWAELAARMTSADAAEDTAHGRHARAAMSP